jgi:hypothetical protein
MWRTLADHVSLFKLAPEDFLDAVFSQLIHEPLELALQMIMDKS